MKKNGAPGETRTPDLQIRSLPLYPTELQARFGGLRASSILRGTFPRHDQISSHLAAMIYGRTEPLPSTTYLNIKPGALPEQELRAARPANSIFYAVFANSKGYSLILM